VVEEGQLLWAPSADFIANSRLAKFMDWLARDGRVRVSDYAALHEWSVKDIDGFWRAVWDYFGVLSDGAFEKALDRRIMPGAKWFEGARVNYAEHILRAASFGPPERTAVVSMSEVVPMSAMSWDDLAARVRRLGTSLRALGLRPGDRVAAYMPNSPETVVAMLATIAIGCVWSSAAPEFGTPAVVDRFSQIEPKLLFAADGYRFNGKDFDRTSNVADIVSALPTLEHLVWLPHLDRAAVPPADGPASILFPDLCSGPSVAAEDFKFERVPSDHPLWILYSSGTTGLPKAIVHGHAGMLVTHLVGASLQMNFGPETRLFFYTTTGWMMFNSLVSALIGGGSIVTYDGSPTHPAPDVLWQLTADAKATAFGASPTFVQGMQKLGIKPKENFDLSHLNFVLCTGSPAQPETFAWFYDEVKKDMWVTSPSGGTDICSAIVGKSPSLPVRAGEIQCPVLGIDAKAFDEAGKPVIDQIGELVIASPAPCMPIKFWNDPEGKRYYESYFADIPGVWRHGDYIKFKEDLSSIIYGRSDSTLNRHGVRIGTSEIYRCVEQIPEVADSIVVCLERRPGLYYMPLFVKLKPGLALDEKLSDRIKETLRRVCSPRHVPDEIHQLPAIPYTLSGKKMEIPVRKILEGRPPETVASRDSMVDPDALAPFAALGGSRGASMSNRPSR
jgi:acetoacetyl-CoA synthetase